MNSKYKALPIFVIIVIIGIASLFLYSEFMKKSTGFEDMNSSKAELIEWNSEELFKFLVDPTEVIVRNNVATPLKAYFELKPEFNSTYDKIRMMDGEERIVIVVPVFTASAYTKNGFYAYFKNTCDERCLTTEIVTRNEFGSSASANAIKILQLLGYETISDIDIDQNPNILQKYDKIILLHSEYVTKSMFDAIINHPKVVYLYPNALYAEISVDYNLNTISLIRGHNYPEDKITNGFDWEFDNTHPFEYDTECIDWEFYEITNGMMLNCWPEQIIWKDELLLKTIKEL